MLRLLGDALYQVAVCDSVDVVLEVVQIYFDVCSAIHQLNFIETWEGEDQTQVFDVDPIICQAFGLIFNLYLAVTDFLNHSILVRQDLQLAERLGQIFVDVNNVGTVASFSHDHLPEGRA